MACCVPKCKSKFEKGCGITFHEFPSNHADSEAWLKAISRKDFVPSTTSNCSRVCSRHFLDSDYSNSTLKRKRLNPGAVPSVFPDYPLYMQKKSKLVRSETSILKRKAAVTTAAKTTNNIFPIVQQTLEKLQAPTAEMQSSANLDKAIQVDCRTLQIPERRRFMKKCSALRRKLVKLQEKCDSLTEELLTLKTDCKFKRMQKLEKLAKEKNISAIFLLDQINNYFKESPRWTQSTIRQSILLRNISSDCYKHIRRSKLLKLPSRVTLAKSIENMNELTCLNSTIEERLIKELELLQKTTPTTYSAESFIQQFHQARVSIEPGEPERLENNCLALKAKENPCLFHINEEKSENFF